MSRGKVSKSPGDGVEVDTWYYDAVYAVDQDDGEGQQKVTKKVEVKLRLIKSFTGDKPPFATTAVKFKLVCKDIGLSIEGTDIEALRTAMWEKLDAKYKIAWKTWLLVKIEPSRPYEGIGSGLTFSYSHVDRGEAFDGSVLLRELPWGSRDYRVRPWPQEYKDKNGKTLACIPATEENIEALTEFTRQIDAMRRKLAEFVKPDQILKTLADINKAMALAAQAEAPAIEDQSDRG